MARLLLSISLFLVLLPVFSADVSAETISMPFSADTFVDSGTPNQNHSLDPFLVTGLIFNPCNPPTPWSTIPTPCHNYRTQIYLHIDESIISRKGILWGDISSASIKLFKFYQYEDDSKSIDAYTAPAPWDPLTITWANSPVMGTRIKNTTFPKALGWQSIDITTWLQSVLGHAIVNNGIVIRTYDSNEPSSSYYSSRCFPGIGLVSCNPGEQPYLLVEYTPNDPPSVPVLISPTERSLLSESEVHFSWEPSTDPEYQPITYLLEVAQNDDLSMILATCSTDSTSCSLTLPTEYTYYWRVTARDAPETETGLSHSETWSFSILPTPVQPEPDPVPDPIPDPFPDPIPEPEPIIPPIIEPIPEPEPVIPPVVDPILEPEPVVPPAPTPDPEPVVPPAPNSEPVVPLAPNSEPVVTTTPDPEPIVKPVTIPEQELQENIPPQNIEESTNLLEFGLVLGATSTNKTLLRCNVDYYTDSHSWRLKKCTHSAPVLTSVESLGKFGTTLYTYKLTGTLPVQAKLIITIHRCKKRSFIKPKTWFSCVIETIEKQEKIVTVSNTLFAHLTRSDISVLKTNQNIGNNGQFTLKVSSSPSAAGSTISVSSSQKMAFKIEDVWVDMFNHSSSSNSLTVPADPTENQTGLLFPFDHIVGVTQWHGNTYFQHPHTGIDFGSTTKNIYAPADGIVAAYGYDTYYGPCLSGGNYLLIQHENGIYTAYFHLTSSRKPDGAGWGIGERVLRGQHIAVSGNSGSWNCQSLSYHLHYETRQQRSQSSHVDPVPLTSIDWSTVPTLNWQQYPGRLSGDNPHPTY